MGQSPDEGFDCSGLVTYVLERAGLHVQHFIGMDGQERPIRHVSEFWDHYGVHVHVPEPGDLLFISRSGNSPTHIGIVRDGETYIHAPGKDETNVGVAPIIYETIALKGLRRALYVRNPIGFKAPTKALERPTYRYHQKLT